MKKFLTIIITLMIGATTLSAQIKTLDYLHLDASAVNKEVAELQQLLADYQVFYSNIRGLHWDIKGNNFFTLHIKFEDLYKDAADKADELAERIQMLGSVPENRFSEYLKVSKVKEISGVVSENEAIENILNTYGELIAQERKVLALASKISDEATATLISDYLKEQEKLVWMLVAYSTGNYKK